MIYLFTTFCDGRRVANTKPITHRAEARTSQDSREDADVSVLPPDW